MSDVSSEGGNPSPRSTPTAFQLHAAILSAKVLDASGNSTEALRSSYQSVVSGGLYRTQDLAQGESLLQRAGLVHFESGNLIPSEELLVLRELPADVGSEILLSMLLLQERPLWLYAAVADEDIRWENVPEADQEVLHQLIGEAARREAFLLTVGKTIDLEYLADFGAAGEEYVVAECKQHLDRMGRPDLASDVHRVSLRSDQLGYDITSPDTAGKRHRIEVKTMGSAFGRAEFFLSRNEARVGQNDPHWSLVVVRRDRDGTLKLLGWCSGAAIIPALPYDPHPDGRWASVRISLPLEALTLGLPLDSA